MHAPSTRSAALDTSRRLRRLLLVGTLCLTADPVAALEVACPVGVRAGDPWSTCGFGSTPCPLPAGYDNRTATCTYSGPPGEAVGRSVAGVHAVSVSCACTFTRIADGAVLNSTDSGSGSLFVAPDQPPTFDGSATLQLQRPGDSVLPPDETILLITEDDRLEVDLKDFETGELLPDFTDPEGDAITYVVREGGALVDPTTLPLASLGNSGPGVRTLSVTPISIQDGVAGEPVSVEVRTTQSAPIVRAIEVNQSLQTWENGIPLVAQKDPTFVRVHLEHQGIPSNSAPEEGATGVLLANRLPPPPGQPEFLGVLPPVRTDLVGVTPRAHLVRGDVQRAVLFRLPQSWLSGVVELQFIRVDEPDLRCQEPPSVLVEPSSSISDCRTTVEFGPEAPLSVRIYPVENTALYGGLPLSGTPSRADLERARLRLLDILPVSRLPRLRGPKLKHEGDPYQIEEERDLLEKVRKAQSRRGCATGCDEVALGLAPHVLESADGLLVNASVVFGDTLGLGEIFQGTSAWARDAPKDDAVRSTGAHEVAHVLGIDHPVDQENVYFDFRFQESLATGPCGAVGSALQPTWPYIEDANNDGADESLIGPILDGTVFEEDDQPWGLRSYFDEPSEELPAPVDPRVHFELMSYCGPYWQWISDRTYEAAYDAVLARNALQPPLPGTALLLIEGRIDFETQVAEITNVEPIDSARAPELPDPDGDFVIGALDSVGNVLDFRNFDADVLVGFGELETIGHFSVALPFSAAIDQVALALDSAPSNVLASRTRSANGPTVTLLGPNGGESFGAETITVDWTASDLDGNALRFDLDYSADGGLSWEPVEIGTDDTSIDLDASELAGSTQALFRVTASDGFRIASDVSDSVFAIAGKTPEVTFASAVLGDVAYAAQNIPLRAEAFDVEDGVMTGASLVWSSDIDGPLGSGEAIDVLATALTPGSHVLSIVATDSDGNGVSASRTITVVADPPRADLRVEVLGLAESVDVGDLGTGSLRVWNVGPQPASRVEVSFETSSAIEVSSATSPISPCEVSSTRFRCELGPMGLGEELLVSFQIESMLPGPGTIVAEVRSELEDPVAENDVDRPPWRARSTRADVNGDGDVDLADVEQVLSALNEAAVVDDDRDVDLDGAISGLDARRVVRECSRARCARP